MKKLMLILILSLAAVTCTSRKTSAQFRIRLQINAGIRPAWIPPGYADAAFYYIPELDVYYWAPRHEFVYPYGGRWLYSETLPPAYGDFDLDNCYMVRLNSPRPWLNDRYYAMRFARYRERNVYIRPRYFGPEREPYPNRLFYPGYRREPNRDYRNEHSRREDHSRERDNRGRGNSRDHGDQGRHGR